MNATLKLPEQDDMPQRDPLRIALIGDGSISHSVRETLDQAGNIGLEIVGVLCRHMRDGIVATFDELIQQRPDVVVECAGHQALIDYGTKVLAAGIPLVIASIGSLADEALFQQLRRAALTGGTRMTLVPGAMAGIDALAAARFGGLREVRYIGRKPPQAWANTEAEKLVDLSALEGPKKFFRGNAREAALRFPKNANVAATVALAGLGFDKTEVELVADPTIKKNIHELMFEGGDGRVEITIRGEPSRANPQTSALTAHSIVRVLEGMSAPVVI